MFFFLFCHIKKDAKLITPSWILSRIFFRSSSPPTWQENAAERKKRARLATARALATIIIMRLCIIHIHGAIYILLYTYYLFDVIIISERFKNCITLLIKQTKITIYLKTTDSASNNYNSLLKYKFLLIKIIILLLVK